MESVDSINNFFRDCKAHHELIALGWDPTPIWRGLECPSGSYMQYTSTRRQIRKRTRIMWLEINQKGEESLLCAYPSGSACAVFPDEMEAAIKILHFMKDRYNDH